MSAEKKIFKIDAEKLVDYIITLVENQVFSDFMHQSYSIEKKAKIKESVAKGLEFILKEEYSKVELNFEEFITKYKK